MCAKNEIPKPSHSKVRARTSKWSITSHAFDTGHFGNKSFQATDCTGTDDQTTKKRKTKLRKKARRINSG